MRKLAGWGQEGESAGRELRLICNLAYDKLFAPASHPSKVSIVNPTFYRSESEVLRRKCAPQQSLHAEDGDSLSHLLPGKNLFN